MAYTNRSNNKDIIKELLFNFTNIYVLYLFVLKKLLVGYAFKDAYLHIHHTKNPRY